MIRGILLTGLSCLAMSVHGQEHCSAQDDRESCLQKVQAFIDTQDGTVSFEEKAQEAAEVHDRARDLLALKNTGDAAIGTAGGRGATNDYLPLIRAILGMGNDSAEDGRQFGIEWSNPLRLPAEHQNKLTVGLLRSEVYQPLRDALRAASLAEQIEVLEEDVDEGDDLSIGFSYSPASARRGRDPDLHEGLFSALLRISDIPEQHVLQARRTRVELEKSLGLASPFQGEFAEVPAARREEYIAAVENELLAQFDSMERLQTRLADVGFYGLLDLVNSQPQLSVTANYRDRDEVVGPDELQAAISYEVGWHHVNSFRKFADRCNEEEMLCLADYLSRDDVIAGLRESPRVSFTLEYSRLERLDVSIPIPGFSYFENARERFEVSANYARYFGRETSFRTRTRFDAALKYQDYSDDPVRQNRGLAIASLTYPIAQGFCLSLGAIYATKPEFRGDVDAEISARAGFIYKVLRDE